MARNSLVLKYLLYPFGLLYGGVLAVRRGLYRKKWLRSHTYLTPIIVIGNLNVGGTGKTPHVEFLIQHFKSKYKIATLSRGYGRKSKGFYLASNCKSEECTAKIFGDEPIQLAKKFADIEVAVCEKREVGIERLILERPHIEMIVLDDAFQHLRVQGKCNILLTDYAYPFYEDFPLPAGRLREFACTAKHADIIIVTKTPKNITEEERRNIICKINPTASQNVFFSTFTYEQPIPMNELATHSPVTPQTPIIAISGIANPQLFFQEIKNSYHLTKKYRFRDHYAFKSEDIEKIITENRQLLAQGAVFLTTEKDATRILSKEMKKIVSLQPFFALPIRVCILFNEHEELIKKIDSYVTEN